MAIIFQHRGAPMGQKRKKVWIHRFQTELGLRLLVLSVTYQIVIWLVVLIGLHVLANLASVSSAAATFWLLALAGTVAAVCLLFLFDTVKFSHRLVGPLSRFEKVIQAITAGQELALLQLRQGDFLHEMKDELNAMIAALEQRGAVAVAKAPTSEATPHRLPVSQT
jgi:hypothetical protein